MDLLKDPIPSLVRSIAIPSSVGFFFNTMFNVVDTYFAGQISTEALAAISLSFPLFFSIIGIGIGLSQGCSALIANFLGQSNLKLAAYYCRQSITLGLGISLILSVIGYKYMPDLFLLLGAEPSNLHNSLDYMNVIIIGSGVIVTQNVLNGALIAQGRTKPFRNFLIFSFFANIGLNQLFIFGAFGWSGFGIKGLALSTILLQSIGVLYLVYELKKDGFWSGLSIPCFIPSLTEQKEIIKQALPASLNMLSIAVGSFIITYFVGSYGQQAIAAYGASLRIEQIILIPTVGLNSALMAITGQNFGAKNIQRIKEAWNYAIKFGCLLMILGGVLIYYFSEYLLAVFSTDPQVLEIGNLYLNFASFTLAGYVIMFSTGSMLQGFKRPQFALGTNLMRQIILPLMMFPVFSTAFGMKGLWICILLIVWIAALVNLWYGRRFIALRLTDEISMDPKVTA